jgi:hypothetical protein
LHSIASILPALPGLVGPKTYAAWPVWRDSTRLEARFTPTPKTTIVTLWHRARDFERQTRQANRQDGALGRNGLAVLHALIFDFLNHATGRLDPSYAALARAACISERSVARGLVKLKAAGVLGWQRRCSEGRDELGRFRLEQDTNAYAILPVTRWKGYRAPPEAPPPQPGAWGDHPPLADLLTQAVEERRHGASERTALQILEQDPNDALAAANARLFRSKLLECQPGAETALKINNKPVPTRSGNGVR